MKKDLSNPDLPYAVAFIKESRLICAEVANCTGEPGRRSHDRSHKGCGARCIPVRPEDLVAELWLAV